MSIILMLIFLSILILVHEAGHFLTAKAFGMRVDKFGFGLPIGPTLFKKKFGVSPSKYRKSPEQE